MFTLLPRRSPSRPGERQRRRHGTALTVAARWPALGSPALSVQQAEPGLAGWRRRDQYRQPVIAIPGPDPAHPGDNLAEIPSALTRDLPPSASHQGRSRACARHTPLDPRLKTPGSESRRWRLTGIGPDSLAGCESARASASRGSRGRRQRHHCPGNRRRVACPRPYGARLDRAFLASPRPARPLRRRGHLAAADGAAHRSR